MRPSLLVTLACVLLHVSVGQQCAEGDEYCVATDVNLIPKGSNESGAPEEVALDSCSDRHQACTAFERSGECSINPGWMIVNCPASCKACHLLDPKVRCDRATLNISTEPVYRPGDMLDMFSSIERDFGSLYNITVLSTEPWVVVLDDFMTKEEADAIISTQSKWERSTDTGSANAFGEHTGRIVSTSRTSVNSWCDATCQAHPKVRSVMAKIAAVTRVPPENYENFQVLKYGVGQRYATHHDYGHEDVQLACGPRILTFFLYLSDVEEGGETAFPSLDIAVTPRKGRALLWPSTLSHSPESQDARTMHEARPVVRGTKYAANAWIHLYNFETPNLWGCTGAFDQL